VAAEAKPEVEIWRRPPKNQLFWPWFPIRSFRQFSARTYRFATIQNITDRQTDRQTTQCAKGATYSTVGQKPWVRPVWRRTYALFYVSILATLCIKGL